MPLDPDLSVFGRIKTKQDFDREREAFELQKRQAQQQLTGQDPAAIKEWQVYNSMPVEDQQRYLQMKRADQIMNLGGQMAVRNPLGGIQEQYTVTPKETETPLYKANIEAETEKAKQYQDFLSNYGTKKQTAQGMLDSMQGLVDAEGNLTPDVRAVVGAKNIFRGSIPFTVDPETGLPATVSGSPAASGKAKIEQLRNQSFLEAYESLRGAGALTNIEGEKGTKAKARIDAAQDEESFQQGVKDLQEVVAAGLKRLNDKQIEAQTYLDNLNNQDPMQAWMNKMAQMDNQNPNANIPQLGVQSPALNMPTKTLDKASEAETIFNAKKAIRNGADANLVKQRLMESGIDPSKAGL